MLTWMRRRGGKGGLRRGQSLDPYRLAWMMLSDGVHCSVQVVGCGVVGEAVDEPGRLVTHERELHVRYGSRAAPHRVSGGSYTHGIGQASRGDGKVNHGASLRGKGGTSKEAIATCKVAQYVAETAAETRSEPTSDSDYRRCIQEQREAGKKSLNTLLGSIQKPSLKSALRNYELAVFASLSGIQPVLDEREGEYRKRQQDLKVKLDAAWDKVKLES